ncbi:MAG: hypothetical protein OEX09_05050 [Candidatus Bathyarchaeota archaeon]|nr:hypothetical protein [Candidatus Bathyarchaeota archaeon]
MIARSVGSVDLIGPDGLEGSLRRRIRSGSVERGVVECRVTER